MVAPRRGDREMTTFSDYIQNQIAASVELRVVHTTSQPFVWLALLQQVSESAAEVHLLHFPSEDHSTRKS